MPSDIMDAVETAAEAAAPALREVARAAGADEAFGLAEAASAAASSSPLFAVKQLAVSSSQVSTAAPGAEAPAAHLGAVDLALPTNFGSDDFLSSVLGQLDQVGEDVLGSGIDMLGVGTSARNSHIQGDALIGQTVQEPSVPDGGPSFLDDMEGLDAQVKIGSFNIKRKHGRQTPAEIAFWPKGKAVAMPKLLGILEKDWKLPRANLSVFIDAGTAHPLMLSTELLRKLPQYKDWLSFASTQTELARARHPDGGFATPSSSSSGNSDNAGIIDRVIFEKLVNVITAVLDAAEKTHNYIIVDRTAADSMSSSTAELLLEMALQKTDACPTVLVIESRHRLKAYQGQASASQCAMLEEIERRCVLHGTDGNKRRIDIPALYSPNDFGDPDKLYGQAYTGMPLPRMPDKDHILSEGGAEMSVAGEEGKYNINLKRLWCYHYSQFMFSSGTHYIFLEDVDQVFRAESLGPVGGIFAHGGTIVHRRMREWLQLGKPSVMLYNSGGVTQAYASLHSAVVRQREQNIENVLRRVQITSSENWARTFGVPDVVMMQELQKRAPLVIRKAIVSVDVLRDSAEDVLHIVTGCFANAVGQLPELGLRTAEKDVVQRAWSQHLVLFSSAASYRRLADFYFFLSCLLLLTTAAASLMRFEIDRRIEDNSAAGLWGWADSKELDTTLRWVVVVVPVFSGVVATVMQRKRALQKWGVLYAGSMQIVAEIYKFRARVLEYDMPSPAGAQENESGKDGGLSNVFGHGASARRARMKFVACVQKIFSNVLDGDMNNDALNARGGSLATGQLDVVVARKDLQNHVEKNLLHLGRTTRRRWKISKVAPDSSATQRKSTAKEDIMTTVDIFDDVDEDDLRSPISIETYMQRRMKPMLLYYSTTAPRMSRKLSTLEYFMMFLDGALVILALPGYLNHWVSFAVTLRVLVMNVIQYMAYGPQLGSLNNGVRDLQNLVTWWDSLSVIDRRTRSAKLLAVSTVEQIMLNHASSRTAEISNVVNPSGLTEQGMGMDMGSEEKASPSMRNKRSD